MGTIHQGRERVHETQRQCRTRIIIEVLRGRRGCTVFEPGNKVYIELSDLGIPEHAVDRILEHLESNCILRITRGIEPRRWHVELEEDARNRD